MLRLLHRIEHAPYRVAPAACVIASLLFAVIGMLNAADILSTTEHGIGVGIGFVILLAGIRRNPPKGGPA